MNMTVQNVAAPAARLSALLSQVAVVAVIKTTALGLNRTDKSASAESERSHNALRGVAKVQVSRLAGAEGRVKEIRDEQNAAREALADFTTAWGDRRLLANTNIEKFMRRYMVAKQKHDELVAKLVADAPALIATAQRNIGSYDIEPPELEEIKNAFSLDFVLEQIPDSESYSGKGMDKAVEDELKRRFESTIAGAYQQAQNDALQRLQKPLVAIVERMAAYNKREEDLAKGIEVGREGYFRDTIISNLHDIAEVFESFNLTGDPALQKIAEQLDAFDGIEAEDLRKNKSLRDDTTKRAQAILESLGDWV